MGHVDGLARDRHAEFAFKRMHQRVVVGGHECIGFALAFGSTGTSDAVRVCIRCIGHIEIDHVGHLFHIETASGNIGRHQNIELLSTESIHGAISLPLGHVALQGYGTAP